MTDPAIPARGLEYRRTQATNARGQITGEVFGNGVSLTASYQPQTGQLTGLRYASASTPLRQLDYGYDVFGNLRRQTLNAGQTQEQYQYDALHRMVSATRTGAATGGVHYAYDSAGNFSLKSDFSAAVANAYVYTGGHCGGGANAVKSVQLASGGTRTYCYDANGNLTGDSAGLSLHYDHQNLPVIAHRGNAQDGFRYGADGLRTRSWGSDGARVYLPGYEHRTDTGQTKTYVGDYAVITHTPQAGGTPTRKVEYLLKDRLGSVDAVADSSGTVIETRGYDAFGKPRSGTWTDLTPPKLGSTAVTPKGFTQHEHLNQLELIHMNGRVYDYTLGRFTGVDPFIQFPLNSQSLNPYSYILNNPLSGKDPSGYSCTPMTGSHVCGADTGAENGQSTSTTTKMEGGITTTTTKTVYANNGAVTNITGRANGASSGQSTSGSDERKSTTKSADSKQSPNSRSNTDSGGKTRSIRGNRNTEKIEEAKGVVKARALVEANDAMARIYDSYANGGYKNRDDLAKDLSSVLVPLTDRWHMEFGVLIFEQAGRYYPGSLSFSGEICTSNNECGVYLHQSEFLGNGEFDRISGEYHSHPTITGPGFSWGDVLNSYIRIDAMREKFGTASLDYISYVSSKYRPLERLDFKEYGGMGPEEIYHDSKKHHDLVR